MRSIAVCLVTAVLLTGCDAWFSRRLDITGGDAGSFAVAGPSSASLMTTVLQFASEQHLACTDATALPLECYRAPVRVWAVSMEKGAVVCYAAMGIPLERRKFETRMDELQKALADRFGPASVSLQTARCPDPPSLRS